MVVQSKSSKLPETKKFTLPYSAQTNLVPSNWKAEAILVQGQSEDTRSERNKNKKQVKKKQIENGISLPWHGRILNKIREVIWSIMVFSASHFGRIRIQSLGGDDEFKCRRNSAGLFLSIHCPSFFFFFSLFIVSSPIHLPPPPPIHLPLIRPHIHFPYNLKVFVIFSFGLEKEG